MTVAVLGCGYVGLALCEALEERTVYGVRRSADGLDQIEATGATPIQADVTDDNDLEAVPDVDAIVYAVSAGGRSGDDARRAYVDGLRTVIESFADRDHPPERLLYTGSTSVYGDHGGDWVTEATPIEPTTEKTEILATAERIARETAQSHDIDGTVVRFAGLYEPGRYRLKRYCSGPVTAGILNMLHRDDAAGILRWLLETEPDTDTVLAVDDEPVEKWTLARWLAAECDTETPPLQTKAERLEQGDLSVPAKRRLHTAKRCSNDWLRTAGYEFDHPTFRSGYRRAIESATQTDAEE